MCLINFLFLLKLSILAVGQVSIFIVEITWAREQFSTTYNTKT